MIATITIYDNRYRVDTENLTDISIPVRFNGEQPNTYGVPKASAQAYEDGAFIGDTRRGGSCNFEQYRIVPHCNGTHTECVGHIALARISVHSVLTCAWIPATLITVQPVRETDETCFPPARPGDLRITEKMLGQALTGSSEGFLRALVVRTLPNNASKKSRVYGEPPPPYFTTEAMRLIVERGVMHLLVDTPSVDRTFDDGKMTCHHVFWNVPFDSHDVDPQDHSMRTITEMIYVPDELEDGNYLLNLQIPAFVADAAPSRPLLFNLTEF